MNTFTYTISGGNRHIVGGSPSTTSSLSTFSTTLTGTTNVTFSLSGLSSYDASTTKKINKVIVDFKKDGSEELIINRPISTTIIPAISTTTFTRVLQTEAIDNAVKNVYLTLYRDDLEVDVIDIGFSMVRPPLGAYEDINLINTDYFTTNNQDEKLLLTFINKNPEVLGLSLIDLDVLASSEFDPTLSHSQSISSEAFNIGFTTEYVQIDASQSNTGEAIIVQLTNIINPITNRPKNNDNITVKYRTRAADPNVYSYVPIPGDPTSVYAPLTANSGFIHLSGYLNWNCGDIIKDINLANKIVNIPLIDIVGTRTNLIDYYFTNVNTGVGTSTSGLVSGGYFMVDLYDTNSCNTITSVISTITAFVNY